MEQHTDTSPRSTFKGFIENVGYILTAVALALLVQHFLIRPFIVNGTSMDPTLKTNEYLLIDRLSYRLRAPERGDVVVFRAPPDPKKFFIKRIIGLPGETVSIQNGIVTILNTEYPEGFVLDEPFITHTKNESLILRVPQNEYVVMGDNRSGSFDSRAWGTLPRKELSGRALLRLLPFSRIDYLPGKVDYTDK